MVENKVGASEINIFFKVLKKNVNNILIPPLLMLIVVFGVLFFPHQQFVLSSEIFTQDLVVLNRSFDSVQKVFSILDFERYITPLKDDMKKKHIVISIKNGDKLINSPKTNQMVYSFLLSKKSRGNIEKSRGDFIVDVNYFIKLINKKLFEEFLIFCKQMKTDSFLNLSNAERKIVLLSKKIIIANSMTKNLSGKGFVDIPGRDTLFLPPVQLASGYEIEKKMTLIDIASLKKTLREMDYILGISKKKNITSFPELMKYLDNIAFVSNLNLKDKVIRLLSLKYMNDRKIVSHVKVKLISKHIIRNSVLSFLFVLIMMIFFVLLKNEYKSK